MQAVLLAQVVRYQRLDEMTVWQVWLSVVGRMIELPKENKRSLVIVGQDQEAFQRSTHCPEDEV